VKLVVLLGLAGLLASSAAAAPPPDGFRDSTRLGAIATALTGRPVYVRCATTNAAWKELLEPWDLHPATDALTFPDLEGSYFAARGCKALEGWLRGKAAPFPETLGVYVLSLVHETEHLRGVNTESGAECAALRKMPNVLRRWFGIKRATVLRAVMDGAWESHRLKPREYRTAC
jgi:hypothetical protein